MIKESKKRRRIKERVHCNLDLLINDTIVCKAFDINEGGLYAYTDHSFNLGEIVKIFFQFGNQKLELKSKVKHIQEGVGIGFMFIDLDNALKNRIKELIIEIQKSAL